jgi:hypothetical protein
VSAKYDWQAADTAIRAAIAEVFAAQRHLNHRKRVNVLSDLAAAEREIQKVRQAVTFQDTEAGQ